MSSISSIGNGMDQGTQAATQFMALNLMKTTLKEVMGNDDGMEFEIMYQALLDYMMNNSSNETVKSVLSATNNGTSTDDISVDKLREMLNNTATYNNMVNTSSSIDNTNTSLAVTSKSGSDMDNINAAVNKYANEYGIDSNLILSIIQAESDFNPNITSSAGAMGLMQVMPSNCQSLGVSNPYDIDENIGAGVKLLKNYLNMYNGNTEMALAAYNAGPGTLANRGVKSSSDFYKLSSETQNYVPKVMSYYKSRLS